MGLRRSKIARPVTILYPTEELLSLLRENGYSIRQKWCINDVPYYEVAKGERHEENCPGIGSGLAGE